MLAAIASLMSMPTAPGLSNFFLAVFLGCIPDWSRGVRENTRREIQFVLCFIKVESSGFIQ